MTMETVTWFNGAKGFEGIQPADSEKHAGVYRTALEAACLNGPADRQKALFDIITDGKYRKFVANMVLA
jgi:cold shock CspA family protein